MESVETIIIDIINNYKDLSPDYSDINELIYTRKQLATYCVTFSTEVSKARKDWKKSVARYEIEKNQKRIKFISNGTTKADYMARANTEQELELCVENECKFFDLDYIFRASKDVLSEMNQHISYLRSEQEQEKFNG